jgi:hypothetical protein
VLRLTVTGVIVTGLLLSAGAALAETSAGATAPAIIPVTGPSVGPSVADSSNPDLILAMVPAETKTGEITPKSGTHRVTSAGHPAPKTAHKAHAKTVVKKTPATTRHVAKTAGAPKTKHVAQTKHKPTVHHAMVGKTTPATKLQPATPPAKGGAATQPVLPRV